MIKNAIKLIALVLLLSGFAGCSVMEKNSAGDSEKAVARVGSVDIYQDQVEEYSNFIAYVSGLDLEEMDEDKKQEYQEMILDQLIEDFLIMEYMDDSQNTVMNEEEEQKAQEYLDSIYFNDDVQEALDKMGISEDTVRHYYVSERYFDFFVNRMAEEDETLEAEAKDYFNANRELMIEVETNHILIDTEEAAVEIRKQLMAGAEFASLAKQYSMDKSTTPDGFAGARILSSLSPEYAQAVMSLGQGEVSLPVSTAEGYYIIQLMEYRNSFDDFDETLRRMLAESKLESYLETLKGQIPVERIKQ